MDTETEDGRYYPWEDVRASAEDRHLQADHPRGEGLGKYAEYADRCPGCHTPPEHLTWVYFRSPDRTWEMLCGRAGWMTVCEWCEVQVDFFLESMN